MYKVRQQFCMHFLSAGSYLTQNNETVALLASWEVLDTT